jgi:hypothetical protein
MMSAKRFHSDHSPISGRWKAGFHTSPNASTSVRNRP